MFGRPRPGVFLRFDIPEALPTHVLADLHRQTPTHMPATFRWDACTIHAATESTDSWQSPSRLAKSVSCETPDPTLHTTDIPTYPASRSHRRYTSETTRYFCPPTFAQGAQALDDRLPATPPLHSGNTALTTSVPQTPAASHFGHLQKATLGLPKRKTRPLRAFEARIPRRIDRKVFVAQAAAVEIVI